MFVRKKKNRSGSVSVQVIDKSKTYRVAKTMGSSKNPDQIRRMFELAKLFITHQNKQYSLFHQDPQHNAAGKFQNPQIMLGLLVGRNG